MKTPKLLLTALFAAASVCTAGAQDLYDGFVNPPESARPRVWWHWMNGNITKDGIKKDLEWMHRSGIAGFHNFDAGLDTPQIVDERIIYMTPEWKDAFNYAMHLSDSLGLEVTIASSPGWSVTGGPWVSQEDAMKKLVWRTVEFDGGAHVSVTLPKGFTVSGKFQDTRRVTNPESAEKYQHIANAKFYKDLYVIGVKLCDEDVDLMGMNPVITTSGIKENIEGEALKELLNDDKVSDVVEVLHEPDGSSWIQYEFPEAVTVKSAVVSDFALGNTAWEFIRELQYSSDGKNYKGIRLNYQSTDQRTYAFAPVTGKYFRLYYKALQSGHDGRFGVSQFSLSTVSRTHMAGDKTANGFYRKYWQEDTPFDDVAAKVSDVVDLTQYVKDGVLDWDAPEGRWRVFRFGYGLTGKCNHPASPEATGYEVDKLDHDAAVRYYNNYLKTYYDATGGKLGPGGIEYLLTDSFEAGPQTWTGKMPQEFKARKGYDLIPWLPALTGMVLNDTEETQRFLFDWRTVIGELMVENHYDVQNEVLAQYGMKRYTEGHEAWRASVADGMEIKRSTDIPQSAFWVTRNSDAYFGSQYEADIRESASVAHIYGQNIVAAESFTVHGQRNGPWLYSPKVLKRSADGALASGLNRFVIHTSQHQPVDDKVPGLSLGPYGQWFNRHQTWADEAKAWIDYLSRSSYLLQQGQFVADAAYYYGEANNPTGIFQLNYPDMPRDYAYDFFGPYVIRNEVKAEDGFMTVKTGMKYRLLMIDENIKHASVDILKKIKEFADAGVLICGFRPQKLATLTATEEEYDALVADIWDSGRPNVTVGVPVHEVFEKAGIEPDFSYEIVAGEFEGNPDIRYVHRKLENGHIYWVANLENTPFDLKASFRIEGKRPVIWHAEDASTEPVSYSISDGRTVADLHLDQHRSVFVMFLDDAETDTFTLPAKSSKELLQVGGPWKVAFKPGWGAPETAQFGQLASWTENEDDGIKYYSGPATYSSAFRLKSKDLKKGRILLDLGDVGELAVVTVNGKDCGTHIFEPFTVDITDAVKAGDNTLEIKVVNMWHNRLVGDVQPDAERTYTYTQMPFVTSTEPLLPSGLMGPVKIIWKSN